MFLLIKAAGHLLGIDAHFNTSHVSINQIIKTKSTEKSLISIHLMFLLIKERKRNGLEIKYFNTSHVSINRYAGGRNPGE